MFQQPIPCFSLDFSELGCRLHPCCARGLCELCCGAGNLSLPSPRYLYVNSRAWPRDCVISDPMQPPPIAEEIDLHVFDLKTMKEVKRALRAHRAYTPNEECFFIFLDVSRDFVASGAEDRHGYIWDRHYNICLAKLQHDNVVNSVAFSPVEQELLLTASDDTTIKVWRSPRAMRIRQARRPRPRKLLFSWLLNQKS